MDFLTEELDKLTLKELKRLQRVHLYATKLFYGRFYHFDAVSKWKHEQHQEKRKEVFEKALRGEFTEDELRRIKMGQRPEVYFEQIWFDRVDWLYSSYVYYYDRLREIEDLIEKRERKNEADRKRRRANGYRKKQKKERKHRKNWQRRTPKRGYDPRKRISKNNYLIPVNGEKKSMARVKRESEENERLEQEARALEEKERAENGEK